MSQIEIAPARLEDLAAVLEIEREVLEAPHWAEAEYRAMVLADAAAVSRCLFVAIHRGILAGFAVGKIVGAEAELESVVVRQEARRTGVGRSLCAAIIDWAWKQGASVMDLEVRQSSLGAIELYTRLGFALIGRRPRYYLAPVEDAILMRLERDSHSNRTRD